MLLESFLHECSELIAKWDLVKEDMGNTENFWCVSSSVWCVSLV